MFDFTLGVFLLLSPIIFLFINNARLNGEVLALQFYQFRTMSLNSSVIQYQFFQFGIILLFIVALAQRPLRDFKDKNIAWFLGICLISVFMHPKTIMAFVPIFLGLLLYYLVVCYAKNIKKLLYVIVVVSLLNTIFAVLQFFHIFFLYKPTGNIFGLMFSPSHLGTYQALALPICYMINPFLTIIPFIGLLLSKSFTPLLAGIIGMIYFFYPKKNKIFINLAPMGLIAIAGILITFIFRNYQSIVYKFVLRLGLWNDIFLDIIRHPLGLGIVNFSKVISTNMGEWKVPQNEFLGIAFYLGIFSWFFIYRFLKDKFIIAKDNLCKPIFASCLIFLIICLGQSPLHSPRLAGTIIPLFAFLEILKRREACL